MFPPLSSHQFIPIPLFYFGKSAGKKRRGEESINDIDQFPSSENCWDAESNNFRARRSNIIYTPLPPTTFPNAWQGHQLFLTSTAQPKLLPFLQTRDRGLRSPCSHLLPTRPPFFPSAPTAPHERTPFLHPSSTHLPAHRSSPRERCRPVHKFHNNLRASSYRRRAAATKKIKIKIKPSPRTPDLLTRPTQTCLSQLAARGNSQNRPPPPLALLLSASQQRPQRAAASSAPRPPAPRGGQPAVRRRPHAPGQLRRGRGQFRKPPHRQTPPTRRDEAGTSPSKRGCSEARGTPPRLRVARPAGGRRSFPDAKIHTQATQAPLDSARRAAAPLAESRRAVAALARAARAARAPRDLRASTRASEPRRRRRWRRRARRGRRGR